MLAVLLATLGLALVATYTRLRWLRQVLLSLPALAVSLPVFLVGLLLVQLFSFRLGWFPAIGASGPSALVLPAVTLALPAARGAGPGAGRSLDRDAATSRT